jgi:hypothetical protein
VFIVALETIVLRRPIVVSRNQIEPNASPGDVIERGAEAGSEKWRIEGGGDSGD